MTMKKWFRPAVSIVIRAMTGATVGFALWEVYVVLMVFYGESPASRSESPGPPGHELRWLYLLLLHTALFQGISITQISQLWQSSWPIFAVLSCYGAVIWGAVTGALTYKCWRESDTSISKVKLEPGLSSNEEKEEDTGEQIIAVHGTFAAQEVVFGDQWWQLESKISKLINAEAKGIARWAVPFQWSGRNIESDRERAAYDLATHLLKLEQSKTPYHLIGHSHGGGIIWKALRLMRKHRSRTLFLRSWTTVGTPFIRFVPPKLDLSLFLPLLFVLFISVNGIARRDIEFFKSPTEFWQSTGALLPNIWLHGTNVVSSVLVQTSVIVFYLTSCLLTLPLFVALGGLILTRVKTRVERLDYSFLASRHLAVWSRHDEALAGLVGMTRISVALLPSILHIRSTFLERLLFTLIWPAIYMYNLFVRPQIDRRLWKILRNAAYGNDRIVFTANEVSPYPVSGIPLPPVAPEIETWLASYVEKHASTSLEDAREALGLFSTGATWAAFSDRLRSKLSFEGLIHNAYFACPDIVRGICEHIKKRGAVSPLDREESPQAVSESYRNKHWEFQWRSGVTGALILTSLYSFMAWVYWSGVAPNSIHRKINQMIQTSATDMSSAKDHSVVAWVGSLALTGHVFEATQLLGQVQGHAAWFPATAELIRWASACVGESCVERDMLLKNLHKMLKYHGMDTMFDDNANRGFVKAFRAVAPRLGLIARVPLGSDFIKTGNKTLISGQDVTHLNLTQIWNDLLETFQHATPNQRSEIQYAAPFFVDLGTEKMISWDFGVNSNQRLENKLWLVSAMECNYSLLPWHDAHTPYDRMMARITINVLWWGSCEEPQAWVKTALTSAISDWNALGQNQQSARLAARLSSAINRGLTQLSTGVDRQSAAPIDLRKASTHLSDYGYRSIIRSLKEQHRVSDIGDAIQLLSALRSADDQDRGRKLVTAIREAIDWDNPPVSLLLEVITASSNDWTGDLINQILDTTSRISDAPLEWDEPIYKLFLKLFNESHQILGDGYKIDQKFRGYRPEFDPAHFARYRALAKLAAAEVLSAGGGFDPDMIRNDFDFASSIQFALLRDLRSFSADISSRIYANLAQQFANVGRFHHAFEYFGKVTRADDRLQAAAGILTAYSEALKKVHGNIDVVIDRGDAILRGTVKNGMRRGIH